MSFLSQNNAEFLSARLTQKGRKSIAQGNFQIKFFQVGDSEFDYTSPFNNLDGVQDNPQQNVLSPFDKDSQVKYPYKLDNSDTTTTYGIPVMDSITRTIRNGMGPAGFITEFKDYDSIKCSGTTVECTSIRIPLSGFTGSNTITFTEILSYGNCSGVTQQNVDILNIHSFNDVEFITVVFDNEFINEDQVVSGNSMSLIYRIIGIETVTGTTTTPTCDQIVTGSTTLTIDRFTPNLSSISGYAQIIRNECKIENPIGSETASVCVSNQIDPSEQHDPWTLNVVWKEKPIGSDVNGLDENISGFTSSKHISTMEYLGYGMPDGQVSNTGTTYNNSYNEVIVVKPEEQKCVAIIHYSELGHIYDDPDRFFKYDDYIGSSNSEGVLVEGEIVTDIEFFNVYIPFIFYENSAGSTIGAEFTMDITDQFIDSSFAGTPGDIRTKYVKFRYLLDEIGNKVGKVFIDKKIIVFDDQELVALLDYRSNRRYTLPAPKTYHVPSDTTAASSVFSGAIAQTYWITYMLEYTGDTQLNSLPCNYFSKVEINIINGEYEITYPSNIALKFGGDEDHPNGVGSFQFLKDNFNDVTQGYVADKLWVLIQETTDQTDLLPDPSLWLKIDITSKIPNHIVGDLITPSDMRDHSFVITGSDLNVATLFDLETFLKSNPTDVNYMGDVTTTVEPQFGDEQPFPGSVKLVRCTDIEEMRFLVNLPNTQFTTTQNPTHHGEATKVVTEVALLDQNKDVLVTAKTSSPIKRLGTQVFAVKIDF